MKYLLLFLFPVLCFGQGYTNYTKITAFRVIDGNREGNTTIMGFINEHAYLSQRLQAVQEEDEALAFALLALKKEAKNWEKKPLPLENKHWSTKLRVPNMYVVQINRHRDTIFTTHDNASIYFPDEQMEYVDPGNYLNGLLNEKLCFFAERNFKGEFLTHKNDSIPANTVLINNKPVVGTTRKGFDKTVAKFQRVVTDSIFDDGQVVIDKQFCINNYRMKFEPRLKNLDAIYISGAIYDKDVPLSVGGIQLDDTEEKLALAFPCSLEYRNINAIAYDVGSNYFYTVHLANNKGFALFYIKNKRVERIEVEFR